MLKPVIYRESLKEEILFRKQIKTTEVEKTVTAILQDIRENGDKAVREYTLKFDGVCPSEFIVSEEEIANAFSLVSKDYAEILKRSKENIFEFHKKQLKTGFEYKKDGIILGQKVSAVERAGIYVPGGTAAYPSTVLMNAVPASVAGVKEIIMVTPPQKDGKIKPEVLVAAKIAGVDKIYKIGGAQAIGALAYGTESVPKVDVITGPGNIYVATAKKHVYGEVGIDMIAGPSEILVIADKTADPEFIAADMLSQAEHDKLATAVLLTDSEEIAQKTAVALEKRLELLPRKEIASVSLKENGKIIITKDIEEAVYVSDCLAPEHLEICTENPFEYLKKVKNAGSVFLGHFTPEATGDYYAGANHTLPTSGTAKFSSPLGVETFLKTTQYIFYERDALMCASDDIITFAESEGLGAHAESVRVRKIKDK